ncbi:MAG: hypothetical protein IKZ52_09500 [Bacteroidales bacterium]|nr:hypothetical protein [Bacteroidales bacterium]
MSSHTITDTTDGKTITAEEFHRQARRWAAMVRNAAKRNTLRFAKGKKQTSITKKSGKVERKLRDSIQFTVERDSGIPEAVSFKVPIHGIWREWAVGYGQPRVPGKYVNPHPRIRRSMADWLDEPIGRNAECLFDLAAEFWGDECLVNFFGTKKA